MASLLYLHSASVDSTKDWCNVFFKDYVCDEHAQTFLSFLTPHMKHYNNYFYSICILFSFTSNLVTI